MSIQSAARRYFQCLGDRHACAPQSCEGAAPACGGEVTRYRSRIGQRQFDGVYHKPKPLPSKEETRRKSTCYIEAGELQKGEERMENHQAWFYYHRDSSLSQREGKDNIPGVE